MSSCSLLTSKLKFLKQILRKLEFIRDDVLMGKTRGDLKIIHKNWIEQFRQLEQQKKEINEIIFISYLEINRGLIFKEDSESLKEKLSLLISKTDESFYKPIFIELTKGLYFHELENIKSIYVEILPKRFISTTKEEALTGKYFVHHGNLDFSNTTFLKSTKFSDIFFGFLNFYNLSSIEDVILPITISESLTFRFLKKAKGLTFPQTVGGNLDLPFLIKAEGLVLPKTIGGNLDLSFLPSAEGLTFPQTVGGNLDLSFLASVEGLVLPKRVKGFIYLRNLPKKDYDKLARSRSDLKFKMLK